MRVLITGASGFVGQALCSALLAEGGLVRAAVRSSNSLPAVAGLEVAAVGEIGAQTDWSAVLADDTLYSSELLKDLRWLWEKRYHPGIGRSFRLFSDNFYAMPKDLARKAYYFLRGRAASDPGVFEHYMDIESHRWALAEIMRAKQAGRLV